MITTQQTKPLKRVPGTIWLTLLGSSPLRMQFKRHAQEAVFPVRIIAKLCAAIASRVPVGFEDEIGFHYGRNDGDCLILIFDSGGQSPFSAGFLTPYLHGGWRPNPFSASKTVSRGDVESVTDGLTNWFYAN
jgi:hypothetical protein